MSVQTQHDPVLTNIELAERELALYAAIIGHRPVVENASQPSAEPAHEPSDDQRQQAGSAEVAPSHSLHLDPIVMQRISAWVKQISQQARRRIDEAKTRLAS